MSSKKQSSKPAVDENIFETIESSSFNIEPVTKASQHPQNINLNQISIIHLYLSPVVLSLAEFNSFSSCDFMDLSLANYINLSSSDFNGELST
ncbi:unnamed protein product [Adineta steineri]|uniref:Uncharacterized protein n=1 Tax=Adineta steineri TaxID=433720 RepID=A0A818XGG4_9BILA|nr:unnamed protein product [Adineta steineri]